MTTDAITITYEKVDRDTALAWLETNVRNRNLRQRDVNKYARDMAGGRWRDTGETIKFDLDGHLIDGQHRLWAIVESDVTLVLLVVRGLHSDAQDVLDTGIKRTNADTLMLNGITNSHTLAAGARLAISYERGELTHAGQHHVAVATNAEVLDFIEANQDMLDAVSTAKSLSGRIPAKASSLTFTLWLLRRIDREQADEFFADLAEMRSNGRGDPRYTLLVRLGAIRRGRERMSAVTEAHYIIRTWIAHRRGEQLASLKVGNAHGSFAFATPEP